MRLCLVRVLPMRKCSSAGRIEPCGKDQRRQRRGYSSSKIKVVPRLCLAVDAFVRVLAAKSAPDKLFDRGQPSEWTAPAFGPGSRPVDAVARWLSHRAPCERLHRMTRTDTNM